MRLKKNQIEKLSSSILKYLLEKKVITPRADEKKIKQRIYDVILKDMLEEDKLDADARKILEAHADKLRDTDADYHRAFSMIKQKLAKERDIVI